jgi:hypothetical protein
MCELPREFARVTMVSRGLTSLTEMLVFFFLVALVSSGSVVLTGDNFDSLTNGKNAFVKFMVSSNESFLLVNN